MEEGVITREMALERTAQLTVQDLMTRRVVAVNGQDLVPLAHAATASSGVAIGEMALDEQRARARVAAGASVILVRRDAETSDMAALASSVGLLTQRGARTSHAAVVARQLGKVCLVGCSELTLDEVARTVAIGGVPFHEGDVITLDGNEGEIFEGEAQTVIEEPVDLLARLSRLNDPANAQQG